MISAVTIIDSREAEEFFIVTNITKIIIVYMYVYLVRYNMCIEMNYLVCNIIRM